jgi:hypothetical protein
MSTLSRQMDKLYLLAVKHNLNEAAEFVKSFIIKYDVIKNNNKVKQGFIAILNYTVATGSVPTVRGYIIIGTK